MIPNCTEQAVLRASWCHPASYSWQPHCLPHTRLKQSLRIVYIVYCVTCTSFATIAKMFHTHTHPLFHIRVVICLPLNINPVSHCITKRFTEPCRSPYLIPLLKHTQTHTPDLHTHTTHSLTHSRTHIIRVCICIGVRVHGAIFTSNL